MDVVRKNSLEESYDRLINIGCCLEPYQDLSDIVDPNVMAFGTTKDEKVFSLEELIDFLKSQYKQMEGIKPSLERKRLSTHISEDQSSALIAEEITLNLVSKEINNSLYVRTSCVFQYSVDRWKLTHWHASTPVETENDHWHMEEWKRENEKLQKLVDQQTADLQVKNRELEIEAAVERVRAETMAMQESGELAEVSSLLFQQMDALGIKTYSSGFTIWDEKQGELVSWMCNADGSMNPPFRMPIDEEKWHKEQYESWKKGEEFIVKDLTGDQMKAYFKYLRSFPLLDEAFKKSVAAGHPMPERQIHHIVNFSHGNLLFITLEPVPDAHDIFKRFARVFEQTYTRFLDLQKAEAQAREAQINLAVERVRAKALAMHKSEEIMEVVAKLKDEVMSLDIPNVVAATIFLKEGEDKVRMWDLSTLEKDNDGYQIPFDITFKLKKKDPHLYVKRIWENPDDYFLEKQETKDFKRIISWLRENYKVQIADEVEEFIASTQLKRLYHAVKKLNNGKLVIDLLDPPLDEMESILTKMGAAFDLAYKRFEDLQKAEAQTREAQIEAALERVRSRSMAMHKSEELAEAGELLYRELSNLGLRNLASGYTLFDETETMGWSYGVNPLDGSIRHKPVGMKHTETPVMKSILESWKKQEPFFVTHLSPEETIEHQAYIAEKSIGFPITTEELLAISPERLVVHTYNFKQGYLLLVSGEFLTGEQREMVCRFAKVFEQTYTRFLDLKKTEAQARESQIQLALERVRARTMAMQKSDELRQAVRVIYEQLEDLNFDANACNIIIMDKESGGMQYWVSGFTQEIYPESYWVPHLNHSYLDAQLEAWKGGEKYVVLEYSGDTKKRFDELFFSQTDFKNVPEEAKQFMTSLESVTLSTAYFSYGALQVLGPEPLSEENATILRRFSNVFEQTYTRFLDLQKAEAQAREAQVELSLERIRAQVTAMQESTDLFDIVVSMRTEFITLGHEADHFWHMRWLPDTYEMSMTSEDGSRIGMVITVPKFVHEEITGLAEWEKSDEPTYVLALDADDAWDYIENMNAHGHYEQADPNAPTLDDIRAIGGLTFIMARTTHGEIGFSLPGVVLDPPEDALETLVRFAGVFDLAYRRFEDLKAAEGQHREAQIELALERVRARAMAMQTSDELNALIGTVFTELTKLDLALTRCLISIYEPDSKASRWWLANSETPLQPDNFYIPYHEYPPYIAFIKQWKARATKFKYVLEGKDKVAWDDYLFTETELSTLPDFVTESMREPDRVVLSHSYNSFGFLHASSLEPLSDEHFDILLRFAKVFGMTYTRFNDLKVAEAHAVQAQEDLIKLQKAKKRAEDAFTKLEAAKDQLVQQEKLASLGQLTAGIAHEIKNPLNFVNNFSEVSVELIEEVREELSAISSQPSAVSYRSPEEESGLPAEASAKAGDINKDGRTIDIDYTLSILDDIEANLKTIHKHGSRADSIVKSMLEHSRGGTGKREPVNLNSLVKEYVNLAFHGMRASKHPINVDIDLQLGESVGEVPLIAEDFSRVIVNLCNNAFDAMREKLSVFSDQPSASPFEGGKDGEAVKGDDLAKSYLPKLTVKTIRGNDRVIVEIEDNGAGIPEEVRDKILQPFFTTKKGTEGTGLGLSITHDIVKAHGGNLDVYSDHNVGTRFTIKLSKGG